MNTDEPSDAPIVASLDGIGEEAGRQLSAGSVVGDALAADSFSGARIVATIAVFHVVFLVGAFLLVGWSHVFGSHPSWFSVGKRCRLLTMLHECFHINRCPVFFEVPNHSPGEAVCAP
jgi:hypothetical protein